MGDLAGWVTAVASLGALLAAVWAAVTARDLYRVEAGRDREVAASRRRGQANQVAAWIVVEIEPGAEAPRAVGVVVHNSSDSVIYDVQVVATAKNGRVPKPIRLELLPPGDFYLKEKPGTAVGWAFAKSTAEVAGAMLRPVTTSRDLRVQLLTFRDSADVLWERTRNGALIEREDFSASLG